MQIQLSAERQRLFIMIFLQAEGTLKPWEHFNSEVDCEALRAAMKGMGTYYHNFCASSSSHKFTKYKHWAHFHVMRWDAIIQIKLFKVVLVLFV